MYFKLAYRYWSHEPVKVWYAPDLLRSLGAITYNREICYFWGIIQIDIFDIHVLMQKYNWRFNPTSGYARSTDLFDQGYMHTLIYKEYYVKQFL